VRAPSWEAHQRWVAEVELLRTAALAASGRTSDKRADKRKKSGDPQPRDPQHLLNQWRRFRKERQSCDTDQRAAMEITGQNEKLAGAMLRQFRRYRRFLDSAR
jgi:hypothetical protein